MNKIDKAIPLNNTKTLDLTANQDNLDITFRTLLKTNNAENNRETSYNPGKLSHNHTTLGDSHDITDPVQNILQEILEDKKNFLQTGDKSVLDKYLKHKAYLAQNDPEELKKYNETVDFIINNSDLLATDGDIQQSTTLENVTNTREMDDFSKYLIASSIAELYNLDFVKGVLSSDTEEKFKIVLFEDGKIGDIAGKHLDNTIFLNDLELLGGAIKQDGNNPIIHEFLHAIDGDSPTDRPDGLFKEMPEDMQKEFIKIRDDLFTRFEEGQDTGLKKIAFINKTEFPAVIAEMFYETPDVLAKASPDLYKIMVDFFKIDPELNKA